MEVAIKIIKSRKPFLIQAKTEIDILNKVTYPYTMRDAAFYKCDADLIERVYSGKRQGRRRGVKHRAPAGPVHVPQPPVLGLRDPVFQPLRAAQEHKVRLRRWSSPAMPLCFCFHAFI